MKHWNCAHQKVGTYRLTSVGITVLTGASKYTRASKMWDFHPAIFCSTTMKKGIHDLLLSGLRHMLSADLRGNRETNLSPGISTVRPSTSSLYIYTVWIQKLCSRNPHRFSNCFQSLWSSNLGCFSIQAERQHISHSLLIPRILSKSPWDQSQSVFKTGQEWGTYLVNHLFKKRKGKEKPTPDLPSSLCLPTHLFSLYILWGPSLPPLQAIFNMQRK